MIDSEIRTAAFNWLKDQIDKQGEVLSRELLVKGFEFRGFRIPLVSPQGIFKPKLMELPLSITTSPNSPYEDKIDDQDILRYKYRGVDPSHRDNVGLRRVMKRELPLIYLHGLIPGRYLVVFPVYIIGDNTNKLEFKVVADDRKMIYIDNNYNRGVTEGRREYVTREVKFRIHQRGFRERILHAYKGQCAICQIKHSNLLDAAHIIPDSEELGTAEVKNGISLCKIHHAAFDQNILGINTDFQIKIRHDILNEIDGPMLKHGIQEMHNKILHLPISKKNHPDKEKLSWRFQKFLSA